MTCSRVQRILDDYVFVKGSAPMSGWCAPEPEAGTHRDCAAIGLRPAGTTEMPEGLPDAVRQHLARCERCQEALREMLALATGLERLRLATRHFAAQDSDALAGRVMQAVRTAEAARTGEEAGARKGSLLKDLLISAGLVAAACPAVLATGVTVFLWLLDARATLIGTLFSRIAGLLFRPPVVVLRALFDLGVDWAIGIVRVCELASSILFDLGPALVLVLGGFTLAMGFLLVAILTGPGFDETGSSA